MAREGRGRRGCRPRRGGGRGDGADHRQGQRPGAGDRDRRRRPRRRWSGWWRARSRPMAGSTSSTATPASRSRGRSPPSIPAGMEVSWQVNVAAHFRPDAAGHAAHAEGGKRLDHRHSSNSGVFYDHEMIAYATSKHAAVAMVKQVAIDYGKYGVRVNALARAGSIPRSTTPSPARWAGARRPRSTSRTRFRSGRFATVEEIAGDRSCFSPPTAPPS